MSFGWPEVSTRRLQIAASSCLRSWMVPQWARIVDMALDAQIRVREAELMPLGKPKLLPPGFDGFTDDDAPPHTRTWQDTARDAFRALVGSEPPVFPLSEVLRPSSSLGPAGKASLASIEPYVYIAPRSEKGYNTNAWLILAPDVSTDVQGLRLAERVYANLTARSKVGVGTPYVHDLPLMVGFSRGVVVAQPPVVAKAERTEPTATELKERIVAMLEPVFGRKTRIIGSAEKGYSIAIAPSTKKHRFKEGRSRTTATVAELLPEAEALLERARAAGIADSLDANVREPARVDAAPSVEPTPAIPWRKLGNGTWDANVPGGRYVVMNAGGDFRLTLDGDTEGATYYASDTAAKNAAKRHYERRLAR